MEVQGWKSIFMCGGWKGCVLSQKEGRGLLTSPYLKIISEIESGNLFHRPDTAGADPRTDAAPDTVMVL